MIAGYQGASVLKIEPDGIKIIHSKGVTKVPFEELSDDVRKRYNLTESEVNQYRKFREREALSEKTARERDSKLDKIKLRIQGTVLQVVPDGILLQNVRAFRGRQEVAQTVKTGQQPVGMGRNSMNPKGDYVSEVITKYHWEDVWDKYAELMFLDKPAEEIGEGKWIEMNVWVIGTYSYTNKLGEERTVELVTNSVDRAGAHLLK